MWEQGGHAPMPLWTSPEKERKINKLIIVKIRECDSRSQLLVWGSEMPENVPSVHSLLYGDNCIVCPSLYPILDAMRVCSESLVRFTRKWTKKVCKWKMLQISLFFTRLSAKPEFYRVRELYYGLGRCQAPAPPFRSLSDFLYVYSMLKNWKCFY